MRAPQQLIRGRVACVRLGPLKPLASLPLSASDGDDSYQIDWPLASQARGDYLIAIEAVKGEEKARVLVPLRVVP